MRLCAKLLDTALQRGVQEKFSFPNPPAAINFTLMP